MIITNSVFGRAVNLWKLNVSVVAAVIVGTHLALHVVIWQHRVVQNYPALRSVALALVLVIIDAVDVYNSLVVLA